MATIIVEVTDDDFAAEVLEETIPVLVDFYMDDCESCELVAPEFKKASREFAGRVKFVMAHADNCVATNEAYGHDAFPVLQLFVDGEAVGEVPWDGDDGFPTHDGIRDFLSEHLDEAEEGDDVGEDDDV